MVPAQFRHTKEEAARLGTDLFERVIKPKLRPEDDGKFYVVDVDSGEFELDTDELAAYDRLLARVPEAYPFLGRAGWPAAHRIGGFAFDELPA
jgi:hypothetical protein